MSIAIREFQCLANGFVILQMKTATETRRDRLEELIAKHGSVAALNTALGWTRTDPKLAQIRNANIRPGREKPYQMGDAMAREIEDTLKIERGWMDTPVSIYDKDETGVMLHQVMDSIPREEWPTALRLLSALKKPDQGNGTTG